MASKDMQSEVNSISGKGNIVFKILHWVIAALIVLQGLLGAAMLHIAWLHRYFAAGILIHEETGLLILFLASCMLIFRVFTVANQVQRPAKYINNGLE
ncbi:hypothetical protein ACJU26_02480 [Acidithiobacillus sp. M4-SHS-6]|uniref:hypothetical protein n=1 Tax=Acidithiobacillus sp. M4-SHS-6 TaxID=3383024 RepID=UPI0039BDEA3B